MTAATLTTSRAKAIQWARAILAHDRVFVLDLETCGKAHSDPPVDIAIVSLNGTVVLNTLIYPGRRIPAEATAVHGITDKDAWNAPVWKSLFAQVDAVVDGATVITWNSVFDASVLRYQSRIAKLPCLRCEWQCAMKAHSDFAGVPETRFGRDRLKWWRLGEAAEQFGIEVNGAHRALADCLTTLAVIKAMAEAEP